MQKAKAANTTTESFKLQVEQSFFLNITINGACTHINTKDMRPT